MSSQLSQSQFPPPPVAKKVEHAMELFGDERIDNYYWLRDDSRTDPEVLSYLRQENAYTDSVMSLFEDDMHCIHFGDCEAFNFLLPRDLHRLRISKNEQLSGGMCDALSFKAPSSLRKIDVTDCPKLERLFCLCDPCSFCKHLQNFQSLYLSGLERLEVIWKESEEGVCLPKLSSLQISACDNMEKLLKPVSLRQLPNLVAIDVWFCKSMKEIFAKESNEDDNIDSTVTLPKSFKKLVLRNLPQLKTVCTSIIVSESRPILDVVYNCPNLINGSLGYKSSHSDPNFVILL